MVTGAVRSCYSRPCRFYPDQTVPLDIVWYFADPAAKVFPHQTVFWPRSNDLGHKNTSGVSEDTDARMRWRNGSPPAVGLKGEHFEGSLADHAGQGRQPAETALGLPVPGVECMGYDECLVLQEDGFAVLAEDGFAVRMEECCSILAEDGYLILAEDGYGIEPEDCGNWWILQEDDGLPIHAEDDSPVLRG